MSEIVNLFKGQAAKIFSCYKESDELKDYIQKGLDEQALKAEEAAKEAEEVIEPEIQKSETELNLETLDQPFTFNLGE